MLVKPAPGLQVRDPTTRQMIPAEGIEIDPADLVMSRLVRDGDLVASDAAAAAPAKKGA